MEEPTVNTNEQMIYQDLKSAVEAKDYKFFDQGDYNLNFVWKRNNHTYTNMMTDTLYIGYKVQGVEQVSEFRCTTIAAAIGIESAEHPVAGGVAIIKPGQYLSSWKFCPGGNGSGILPWGKSFFQQVRPINYYRDNNLNNVVDYANEEDGRIYGTNWHIMAEPLGAENRVAWSAGCLGVSESDMLNIIDPLCRKAASAGMGYNYTGTIMEAEDFQNQIS